MNAALGRDRTTVDRLALPRFEGYPHILESILEAATQHAQSPQLMGNIAFHFIAGFQVHLPLTGNIERVLVQDRRVVLGPAFVERKPQVRMLARVMMTSVAK